MKIVRTRVLPLAAVLVVCFGVSTLSTSIMAAEPISATAVVVEGEPLGPAEIAALQDSAVRLQKRALRTVVPLLPRRFAEATPEERRVEADFGAATQLRLIRARLALIEEVLEEQGARVPAFAPSEPPNFVIFGGASSDVARTERLDAAQSPARPGDAFVDLDEKQRVRIVRDLGDGEVPLDRPGAGEADDVDRDAFDDESVDVVHPR